ncbi:MAG: fascin domain-containing protein [Thermoanaerobaculia bacterium]
MRLLTPTLRGALAGLLLAATLASASAAGAVDARDVLGVAHAAGRYNFTDGDFLNEGADRILELGSRVIKIFFVPYRIQEIYPFNSDWSPTPADVVELAQKPYVRELFAKPFSTILLDITPVTVGPQFLDGLTPEEAAAERDQMYRLAKYLLTTYANSGKTFILQNWEGDHLLRQGLAEGVDPDPVRIQGMIDWWNARQDGVEKARREVGARGVQVLHAAEVNLLTAAMAGKVTAANNVVPYTRCDLYSYSSWDIGFSPEELTRALDYLESKAPDNKLFGRYNLYLGEYGMAKGDGAPEGQRFERIRQLMETALGWGVRYAVYWEVYCNEALQTYTGRPGNRDLRGFWLIRPDGEKAPMWSSLELQLPAALRRVSLSSFANQYFSVDSEGDGAVSAGRWVRGGFWETFTLKDWNGGALADGDEVSLQAHGGLYLSIEPGAGGQLYANTSTAGPSERFVIHKIGGAGPIVSGDSIALQVPSGRYLSAEVRGRGAIRALRYIPGPAEVFRYLAAP